MPTVHTFDDKKVKEAIKNSPPIIKKYIETQKRIIERYKDLVKTAKKKLKEQQKEIDDLNKLYWAKG